MEMLMDTGKIMDLIIKEHSPYADRHKFVILMLKYA
jgi:hypothetical protein